MSGYLLKNLDRLREIMEGKRISLFLDYDGTITPIAARPERATLTYQMKEILKAAARAYPTAIVSGRSLADVMGKVGMEGITYAGNHGAEIRGEGFTMVFDAGAAFREEIKRLEAELNALARAWKGVIVENKGHSITLHYRLLDTRSQRLLAERYGKAVEGAAARGAVRLSAGKKSFEIRHPAGWNKGNAVAWLLDRKIFRGTYPVYIGDDETDKDAFRAIAGRGMSVFVGGAVDEADYYLVAQTEVRTLLKWLCNHPVPKGTLFGNF
ncbi:MAG: trehalose-phosphatase [Deltaproteobacteria bacterium]|nr:trehalose-phosphatase [Deltaproteobacteria bacterium]